MVGFGGQVAKWATKADKRMQAVRQLAICKLCWAIIDGTPVRTGLLRGNWRSSINMVTRNPIPLRSAEEAHQEVYDQAIKVTGRQTFYFRNNLPYARPCEYGWSAQAPQGMFRINVMRWREFVREANREVSK